jgi:hypothetical protein
MLLAPGRQNLPLNVSEISEIEYKIIVAVLVWFRHERRLIFHLKQHERS